MSDVIEYRFDELIEWRWCRNARLRWPLVCAFYEMFVCRVPFLRR